MTYDPRTDYYPVKTAAEKLRERYAVPAALRDPMDVEHVYVDCPQCDSEILSWQTGEPGEQVQVYCENCQESIIAAVKGEDDG